MQNVYAKYKNILFNVNYEHDTYFRFYKNFENIEVLNKILILSCYLHLSESEDTKINLDTFNSSNHYAHEKYNCHIILSTNILLNLKIYLNKTIFLCIELNI